MSPLTQSMDHPPPPLGELVIYSDKAHTQGKRHKSHIASQYDPKHPTNKCHKHICYQSMEAATVEGKQIVLHLFNVMVVSNQKSANNFHKLGSDASKHWICSVSTFMSVLVFPTHTRDVPSTSISLALLQRHAQHEKYSEIA